MKNELKPCPFCGGEAVTKASASTLNAYVSCPRCSVVMKQGFKGSKRIEEVLLELIAEAWNRRAADEVGD